MKAILLSAGQGSRLLPLTQDRPKCLLPLAGRSLLEWQIEALAGSGIRDFVVVVGFRADLVEREIERLARPGLVLRTIFNPFFNVADNLGSCWLARHEMSDEFLILNGDTVFQPGVPERLLAASAAPIVVTIDRKKVYDADDMKVRIEGDRLVAIGKTLSAERVNGESIGLLRFAGDGPRLFREAVERAMRAPEGLKWWYLRVIDDLAASGVVAAASIEGLPWAEVDYPADLVRADGLAQTWLAAR